MPAYQKSKVMKGPLNPAGQETDFPTRLILESAGEGIYGLDTEGRTTFINPAAEKMTGFSAEEVIGQCQHLLVHHSKADGTPYDLKECHIYAAFRDRKVHRASDEVFWKKDGTCFPAEYVSTPVLENGRLVGAVVVFRDITERKRAEEEIQYLRYQLDSENAYLHQEMLEAKGLGHIVGQSLALKNTISQIEMVAPTDANVLIFGESGTGKELVASQIHNCSPRKDRPMIKVNCASLPRELYESEFFGHVKGAFSGACRDRVGRFELADRGTLFLDEVGEIPLDLQGKLLRILQEGTYERVGDEKTCITDVRIIASTNRDLKEAVKKQIFRPDLYYRLNVFPIEVTPLREREEDIPLLAKHFLALTSKRLRLPAPALTPENVCQLQGYHWPGNVRELQNLIERAVITSFRGNLSFDISPQKAPVVMDSSDILCEEFEESFEVVPAFKIKCWERQNILRALKKSGGKVAGAGGAAELLGIKSTTLSSKIRKIRLGTPDA